MNKNILTLGIIFLFVLNTVAPVVIGFYINSTRKNESVEEINNNFNSHRFDRYDYPEWYSTENQIIEQKKSSYIKETAETFLIEKESILEIGILNGPMDSPWPMHGHDACHTGRSPFSTADNTGFEKWRFGNEWDVEGGAVIDANGTIYFGTLNGYFYALYPNGTQKWKTKISWFICVFGASPAIDENGIIYVPTKDGLYALNPNGTIKWNHGGLIESSPVIGNDGTIYFCEEKSGYVKAFYPNGTLKWKYKTDHHIQSSPAIGLDGTLYCGSHDTYVYAFYPNNGTLKWKFKTGNWVHGSPSIGSDGTVYIGSDDKYLYALYPNNGTLKWKLSVGSMRSSPSIDKDGILYFGVWGGKFFAVYPNGTIKWSFNLGEDNGVWGSTAAISDDGTIYFGACIEIGYLKGGDIIALNPDGTEKWRLKIATDYVTSSPCIGEDGTVYIGSSNSPNPPYYEGYLHALNMLDPDAPTAPEIDGPKKGVPDVEYNFTFKSASPLGNDLYYWIDWGDNKATGWIGPYPSGQEIIVGHEWWWEKVFTIKARCKDTNNLWSPWETSDIIVGNIPPNKPMLNGPTHGTKSTEYTYTANTTDANGDNVSYFFDWGDGKVTGWTEFVPSGVSISLSHSWLFSGTYTIMVKAKDDFGKESYWGMLEVYMPREKTLANSLFLRFLKQFSLLESFLTPLIYYTFRSKTRLLGQNRLLGQS